MSILPEYTICDCPSCKEYYDMADTAPAEMVTEEMIEEAQTAYENAPDSWSGVAAALRAIAPMIAARAVSDARLDRCVCAFDKDGNLAGACMEHSVWRDEAVAAEREACARIAERHREGWAHEIQKDIAAAIRARGQTP